KPGAQPWARLLQWSQTQCSLPNSRATSMEYQLKEYLLLLATLVATVTYAAGLNLPGGVWQEDTHGGAHIAGDPILPDTHYRRYLAFYYCNATAFAASLVACLLLLFLNEEETISATVLRAVMVLDLFGLMGAYAAGSCRDLFTTIYSSLLVSAVFAYITKVFITYTLHRVLTNRTQVKGDANTQEEDYDANGNPERQDEDYDAKRDPEKQDEERNAKTGDREQDVLILLATFVVAITYMAGLGPPGGFWGSSQDGHRVSDPIMQDHYSARYQAFFVCNTTAFVASLLVIVLLMDKELSKAITGASKAITGDRTGASTGDKTGASKAICKAIFSPTRFVVLYGFIAVALTGLMGAYAAGSCREADATIYVVCLAGAVLASIFLQVAIPRATKKKCWGHNLLKLIHDL
uniref:PGG domain-containing protein n=1 Tax=Aegilops tauschii subsp. strangulata TaxID=200361 RepID=A0A453GJT3_AEGTS